MAKKLVVEKGKVVQKDVPEVVIPQDVQLVISEGRTLGAFLAGIIAFFTTASELEAKASASLTLAQSFRKPASKDEDSHLQAHVRSFAAGKALVVAHWEPLTSLVYRFHKRLVAHRDRPVKQLDEAIALGTKLHNIYTEEELRRAREEEDRKRREEERRAQEKRNAELRELEEQALKAEAESPDLSEREKTFVNFYVDGYGYAGDDVGCARRAGYKDPEQAARRLMSQVKIHQAIQALRTANEARKAAQVVAQQPLDVDESAIETKAQVETKGNVTRWSAEILDRDVFIRAVVEGKHGIPLDVLTIDEVVLNRYARDVQQLIDRWPGVRAKKSTSIR